MKRIVALIPASIVIILLSWTTASRSGAGSQSKYGISRSDTTKDSVVYYDSDIKTRQKSYKKELLGNWNVVSMRRQQKADLENLSNVYIWFNTDLSFTGKAPCDNISGNYILKGTSIKFDNVLLNSTMSCDNSDREGAFLKLLEETVSEYSVTGTKLLLRDGSSNIVFECEKSN